MLDYIERKRFIVDSLVENLNPIPEEDLIGYILTRLDSSYATFIIAFMMKSDGVFVDDLLGFPQKEEVIIEHEHNRHVLILTPPITPTFPIFGSIEFMAQRLYRRSTPSSNNLNVASPNCKHDNCRRRPMC